MLPHHQPDRVRIAFDDHRLVANAGLILPSTPVYPGVGGEPTPDDIGPGQVSSTTTTGLRWRLHPAFAAGGAASLVGTASPFVA